MEFDESGQELDENAIQALLHGICNADESAEDGVRSEVLVAPATAEFDGIYEQGGNY